MIWLEPAGQADTSALPHQPPVRLILPRQSAHPGSSRFTIALERLRRLGDVSFKWPISQAVANIIEIGPRSLRPYKLSSNPRHVGSHRAWHIDLA